jgi:hypothetical protein
MVLLPLAIIFFFDIRCPVDRGMDVRCSATGLGSALHLVAFHGKGFFPL